MVDGWDACYVVMTGGRRSGIFVIWDTRFGFEGVWVVGASLRLDVGFRLDVGYDLTRVIGFRGRTKDMAIVLGCIGASTHPWRTMVVGRTSVGKSSCTSVPSRTPPGLHNGLIPYTSCGALRCPSTLASISASQTWTRSRRSVIDLAPPSAPLESNAALVLAPR